MVCQLNLIMLKWVYVSPLPWFRTFLLTQELFFIDTTKDSKLEPQRLLKQKIMRSGKEVCFSPHVQVFCSALGVRTAQTTF